jgi:hypothetical protein
VLRLQRALYGPRQAPRAWYEKVDGMIHKLGFIQSEHEGDAAAIQDGRLGIVELLPRSRNSVRRWWDWVVPSSLRHEDIAGGGDG